MNRKSTTSLPLYFTPKLVSNLPVARFWYKGTHTHPVRRTVLITAQTDESFTGYELREGNAVRTENTAPLKTYCRKKIARTHSLRLDNPLRRSKTNRSTLVRRSYNDLTKTGI
jgi:hypothetical protein